MTEKLKVLVADDEPIIRDGLRIHIPWEKLNLELVDCVSNGEKALTVFARQPVDILITDIEMPKLGGLDLIDRLIALGHKPAVLIISGYDNFQYAQRAIQFDIVCDYILKPVDLSNLVTQLRQISTQLEHKNAATSIPSIDLMNFDQWVVQHNLKNFNLFSQLHPCLAQGDTTLCRTVLMQCWEDLTGLQPPLNFLTRYCTTYVLSLANFSVEHSLASTVLFGQDDPVKQLADATCADQLLALVLAWTTAFSDAITARKTSQRSALVTGALLIIQANCLSADFSIQQLSEKINVSPNYLSAKFKEEMGISCTRYINYLKIERAKLLLRDVNPKIYEIADLVGIKDYRYFTKLFKELTGMTPAEYRNHPVA